jgi:hypothetical protein
MERVGRGALLGIGSAFHLFLYEPFVGALTPAELRSRHGLITIIYGPDGRMIGRSYEAAQALYVAWKAHALPEERLDILCHAASAGHPAAQHAQAVRHQLGLFDTPIDLAEAYLWARLAELGGDARAGSLRKRLADNLDPAIRAEADARYATWSPSPCPSPLTADQPPAPPSATATARSLGSGTAAATTMPGGAGNLFICAMNPNEANPSIGQQALAFFGGSLTADEVAGLHEAFAYYLDAVGAI